ncbi:MAG: cation-transporting P-type ATPase, partial [Bacteroidota bacterium]
MTTPVASTTENPIGTMQGLSSQQAKFALQQHGFNELPLNERKRFLKIMLGVVMEPMFVLLLLCFVIYLLLGDWTEAVMLLGFVAISIVTVSYTH